MKLSLLKKKVEHLIITCIYNKIETIGPIKQNNDHCRFTKACSNALYNVI